MSGEEAGRSSDASQEVVDLVIAMLAVGGYSLQRVWDIQSSLEREGLVDPEVVKMLNEGEVVRRLAISGYDRGPIVTASMAKRLMALHAAVRDGILTRASRLMREGRPKEAEKTLCSVKGIGSIVFKQFAALRGMTK